MAADATTRDTRYRGDLDRNVLRIQGKF